MLLKYFYLVGSVIWQYTCSCHKNWALKCLPYTPCCTWNLLQTAIVATTCWCLTAVCLPACSYCSPTTNNNTNNNCQWNFHHKFYFLKIDVALLWALFLYLYLLFKVCFRRFWFCSYCCCSLENVLIVCCYEKEEIIREKLVAL